MFWGVTILGGRRYTQTVEKSYHISKAVLDVPIDGKVTGKRVQLMLEHNKSQHLLSNLDSDKNSQVDLDLIFTEGEEITFYLNGEGAVHLSGYVLEYNDFDEDDDDDEDLFDEESEVEELPVKKNSGDALNQNAKRVKNDVSDSGFVSSKKVKTNGSIKDDDDDEDSDDALGNLDEEFDSADEEDDEELDDEEDDEEDEEEDEEDEPKQVKPAPKVNGQAPKGLQQQKGTPGQKGQQQGGQGGQKNTPGKPNNNQTPGKQNNTPGKPNNNNQTPKGGQPNQNNKFGQNKGQNNSPLGQNKPNNNNQKGGPQQQNQQKGGQNNNNNKFQQINKQKGGSFTPDQKASKNFNKFNKNKGRKSFA